LYGQTLTVPQLEDFTTYEKERFSLRSIKKILKFKLIVLSQIRSLIMNQSCENYEQLKYDPDARW